MPMRDKVGHEPEEKREKHVMDGLDADLVAALTVDGQASAGRLAEECRVTSPTVRTRLKNLMSKGVLRLAGLVNPFRTRGLTVALVCLTVQTHEQMDRKLRQIGELGNVAWAAVVTGRYDIVAEVVCAEGVEDLYRFINEDLAQVGGINTSESFVVMKGVRKWVLLPERVRTRMG